MKAEFPMRARVPGRSVWLAGILAGFLAAGCDALMSTEGRIERGQAELEAGEYTAAMADARTALEEEPENSAGRVLLARVMLKMGDAATARKEFDRAVEAGADPDAIRHLHYDILAGQGRHDDILIAAAVDEALEPQRKLKIIAAAESAIGEHDKALATIAAALARDAGDPEAVFVWAQALWGSGQQDDALKALDELLAKQPQHARAALYRGRYALSLSDPAGARKAFLQARTNAATQLDMNEQMAIGAGLVEAYIGLNEMTEAARELADLNARAPDSFLSQYLKGRLAYARGDYELATAELQRALVARPDTPFVQLLLGASLLRQGSLEQAEAGLSRLLATDPAHSEARTLLARVYLARSDEQGARRVLSEAPQGAASSSVSLLSSGLMLRSGQTVEAIALLEKSASVEPDNASLKLDLVRAYMLAGQTQQAIDTLTAMPADAGGSKRRQLLVLAAAAGRNSEEGTRRIERLIGGQPADNETLVTAGAYFLSIGDNTRAGDAYRRALKLSPTDRDALIGTAALDFRAGDIAGAEKLLRAAIEQHPAHEQAYLALSDIAMSRREAESARRWLEQAVSANPAAIESRLRMTEMSLENRDLARADSLVEQTLAVTKHKAGVLQRFGGIYLRAGQYDRALTCFLDAAAQGAQGAGTGAARALLALGRKDEARSRLEGESRVHPASVEPVAILVSLDVREKRFEQAIARVASLERAGAAAGDIADLRGDIQMASGDHRNAAASFAAAARGRPTAGLATKEFQARAAAGIKTPEAPLVRWLDSHPNSVVTRMTLAAHYRRSGRNADAVAQYEGAIQFGPNPDALNNLAWIYHETGDPRAMATARRAYELAPKNAAIADTYGWILVEKGSAADGLRILAEAAKAAPSYPDIQFHHAVALARNGNARGATAILRKVLTPGARFASRKEAEVLMKQLAPQ